ncbi:MAG: glycosyltransferase [Phocaeicola coprocola]|uniref:glycosyltransferase n=1 Tax=Phocaeicola coprocola TaxID=310298 RepID=UPI00399C2548
MKYILVIDHIATGGAERILVDYYHYLEKHGHEAHVFVLSGHKGESKWTEGLNVTYGSGRDENNLMRKAVQQFNLYFRLKTLVRKIEPDVIFSFLEKSNLLTILTSTHATKVVSVHNVLSIQYTKIKSDKVRSLVYAIIKWMYNRCPNVIAVSKQVKDDLIDSFKVKPENIHIINNYVDRDDIKEKAQEPIDNFTFQPDRKYIMNIGRFSDQKAQWKLIKAFSIYRQQTNEKVELVLMGHGEYTEELKKLAEKLHISAHTHFLPFNINPYKYMTRAYLFALSSIYEGFPIVLAEASSLRIPFVGTQKALPEEMFSDKNFWNECIFKSSTLEKDFSTEIHQDEKELAVLLKKGIEDTKFRIKLLENTVQWESNNTKTMQFEHYTRFGKNN